jgi:membrane associated rhomboid family serine protease
MGECRASLELGGALVVGRVWVDGEWWRVVTAGLEHGSWLHLILNIWSLWVVGQWAERCWGSARVLLLFVVTSIAGCLASMAWAEAPVVVGASAGILGIAAALWVVRLLGAPERKKSVEEVSARALGVMLGLMVLLGFVVPVVAQAGHIGGLATGAWIGWLWRGGVSRATTQIVGWLAVAAAVAALTLGARAPAWRPGYDEFIGYRLLERGDAKEAIRALDRALESRPDDAELQNGVAYALAEAGVELERAEVLVRRALDVERENADYLDTLGWIFCRRGETAEGLIHIEQASALAGGTEPEIEGHLRECAGAAL